MNKENLKITTASPLDLDAVMLLWKEQYDFHYALDPVYYVPYTNELGARVKEDLAKLLADDDSHVMVAKVNDKTVGFITFGIDSDDYYDANITEYGVIKELLVTNDYRGQGVGAALIAEVENYFRQQGLKNVMIQCSSFNKNALAVYDKLGYATRQELLYKAL